MSKKLETRAMLNPICQECSKKDTCNDKTLCACLIPKDIKIDRSIVDAQEPLQMPIKLTPEMLNKSLYIGIDFGKGESQCGRR